MKPHALLVSLATIAALALGGCGGTATDGVSPGNGPAASESAETPVEGGGATDEPTEEPTKQPTTANFTEKYVYEDKVEVEVIKIQHGRVTRADEEYAKPEAKAGDDYVILTVRVKNGSKVKLDAYSSWNLTYGADGTEAKTPYLASRSVNQDISGKILPGRSKTATDTFAIPKKYQNDPVLEFTFDFEHEAAIFSGSIK
jgi:hypothetical protein